MESEYALLKKYSEGYSGSEEMMDVAYRFYHLGKMLDGLSDNICRQYVRSMPFIYQNVGIGCCFKGTKEILVDIHDAEIQKKQNEEEILVPALYCIIKVINNQEELLHEDGLAFEVDDSLDEEHFYTFLQEAAKRSLLTHRGIHSIHPTSLECFVKYAFGLGHGLSLEEAISQRHHNVQEYLSDINPYMYNIPEEVLPDQGHLCLN
jgi:hypothetical protein